MQWIIILISLVSLAGIAEANSAKVTSDPAGLHTNIVMVKVNEGTAAEFVERLEKVGAIPGFELGLVLIAHLTSTTMFMFAMQ